MQTSERSYSVHVTEWKLKDYLAYQAYHAYDMKIPIRIPGWKWLEERMPGKIRWGMQTKRKPTVFDRLKSWTITQDLRCYALSAKGKHICSFEVTEEFAKEHFGDSELLRGVL